MDEQTTSGTIEGGGDGGCTSRRRRWRRRPLLASVALLAAAVVVLVTVLVIESSDTTTTMASPLASSSSSSRDDGAVVSAAGIFRWDGANNATADRGDATTAMMISRRRRRTTFDDDDRGRRRGRGRMRRLRAMPSGGGGGRPAGTTMADYSSAAIPPPVGAAADYDYDDDDDSQGVLINLLRRAKDVVSDSDVPFLLQIPHTNHEVLYDIMTRCYGLTPRVYSTMDELKRAKMNNAVDNDYVSFHDEEHNEAHRGKRPLFHFLATPHYQEGARLLTLKHKGRMIVIMTHPVLIAEGVYLSSSSSSSMTTIEEGGRGQRRGRTGMGSNGEEYDVRDLVAHVNSTNYYDNFMTRMLANVPPNVDVTDEHFKEARMILENKFLIGMSSDLVETVQKRLGLYFGWREVSSSSGECVSERIRHAKKIPDEMSSRLVEKSPEWRFVSKKNRYDVKLYARAMAVFGDQKMRVPIHPIIRAKEKAVVDDAFFGSDGHLRDVSDPREESDLPFFWHVPKASGTTVKETLSDCYGLVRNEMIRPPSSLDVLPEKLVLNVDLSTPDAVKVARKSKLVERNLADVYVSQLGLEGSTIFTSSRPGRAFTILRHPVKLAASLFYYRRIATWEPTYRPEFNDITLMEYVEMDGYYDNWMVRMLTNAKLGGLNDGHLELARSILERKFVVGMSEHMDETFRHFEMYYGWKEKKVGCVQFHLHSAPSNKNKYPDLEQGGEVWMVIANKNKFDMSLYYYALELFERQSEKMFRMEKAIV